MSLEKFTPAWVKRIGLATVIGLFVAGIVFWGGFNWALEATNKEAFCISCHEMEENVFREYQNTIHYTNRTGVRATCPDCHVPKDWGHKMMRKIQASQELYGKIMMEIRAELERLDSVRAKLIAGTMDFGEAVNKYSNDDEHKFTGGQLLGRDGSGYLTIDQLDKDMVLMLKNLKVGQYSQPTEFTDERGRKGVRIVYLKTRSEPHRENLKDDYNRIGQRALEEKKNQVLEQWFMKKVITYHIMVDDEFKSCPEMKKWLPENTASKN